MNTNVARREFLAVTGMSAVAAATRTLSAQPPAPKPPQGVRESVAGMAENHPTLVSYRKGVAAMKSLKADNPLSWDFQAGLHGFVPDGKEHAEWAWCQHGNWWFLPWHRGYLHFFERIVRKLSGDPNFNLPYWPWEQPSLNVLPVPFRTKVFGNAPNALYDGTRTALANGGNPLRPAMGSGSFALEWDKARKIGRFTGTVAPLAFGGVRVPTTTLPKKPSMRDHGGMETLAHDYLHVAVGSGGNMGDPKKAAQDPIFWLHHANVDRLWNRWLDDRQHQLPDVKNDKVWYEQKFPFHDENGVRKEYTVAELLKLAGDATVYDEESRKRPPVFAAMAEKEGMVVEQSVVQVGSVQPDLKLGTTDFRKPISLGAEGKPKLAAVFAAQASPDLEPPAVVLEVEGIQAPASQDVAYEVFVAKKGEAASEVTYLGPITFFGRQASGHDHGHGKDGFNQGFDATEVVQKLRRANQGVLPELDVIIRPVSVTGKSAQELAKLEHEVPFKNVTLKVVTEETK
jgi:tyrosinase